MTIRDCRCPNSVVNRLPQDLRDLLVDRLIHGLSCAEIGEKHGLTELDVMVQQHRAMTLLRTLLDESAPR